MKKLIYIIFFLLTSIVWSQESRSMIGRSYLFVGQQTTLTYMVKMKTDSKFSYQPFKNSIKSKRLQSNGRSETNEKIEVEIIQPFHDTIVKTKENEKMWIGSYTITAWDSGYIEIPKSTIIVDDKNVSLTAIVLKVDLSAKKKGQDIYDIKETYSQLPPEPILEKVKKAVKKVFGNYWVWIIVVLLLVSVFVYYKWKKKRSVILSDEVIIELTPQEKALAAISELELQRLWEKGKLKTHYIELSHILRAYLSEVLEIHLLEKTTTETKLLLAQKGVRKDLILKIEEVLQQSDMVKFAKSSPDELSILAVSVLAKEIIQEVNSKKKQDVE